MLKRLMIAAVIALIGTGVFAFTAGEETMQKILGLAGCETAEAGGKAESAEEEWVVEYVDANDQPITPGRSAMTNGIRNQMSSWFSKPDAATPTARAAGPARSSQASLPSKPRRGG